MGNLVKSYNDVAELENKVCKQSCFVIQCVPIYFLLRLHYYKNKEILIALELRCLIKNQCDNYHNISLQY